MLLSKCLDLVLLTLFYVSPYCTAAEQVSPYFKTEPSLKQKTVNVISRTNNDSSFDPGYIFLTRAFYGPEIYDVSGNLVWSGFHLVDIRAMRLNLCNFNGAPRSHPCFHESVKNVHTGHHPGYFKFLDDSYSQVEEFRRVNELGDPDGHEVNTPAGCPNCLVQIIYRREEYNITENGVDSTVWILNSCFQDIDMETKELTFEWCCRENLGETAIQLYFQKHEHHPKGTSVGIDFFHMNGVDRNPDGDYLLSLRQIDSVIKIAGLNSRHRPGSVIWRLGQRGTIKLKNFAFTGQHTCRFVNSTSTTETISFFNNAYRGGDRSEATSKESAGYLIEIDHKEETARLLQDYKSPSGQLSSTRGSMQVLPNGNALVGWGGEPKFTEFDEKGNVLLHVEILDGFSGQVWKYPWVGRPKTLPNLVVYSFDCEEFPLFAYISWNGTTEVTHWRFFTSDTTEAGPWKARGTYVKTGFETKVKLGSNFSAFAYADALSASGEVLATTGTVWTFVPRSPNHCTGSGCHTPAMYHYSRGQSRAGTCRRSINATTVPRVKTYVQMFHEFPLRGTVFLLAAIEGSNWLSSTLLWEIVFHTAAAT